MPDDCIPTKLIIVEPKSLMGILEWIRPVKRRHEKHAEFEHTTFGTLKFTTGVGWCGWQICDDNFHGHFSIVIEGDLDGPFVGATEDFTRLGRTWFTLCQPTTHVIALMLVRHFPDAPTLYFVRGNIWSHMRLTSMHLYPDGAFKLWFQFNFQGDWEDRFIVVDFQPPSITKIEYECRDCSESVTVQ